MTHGGTNGIIYLHDYFIEAVLTYGDSTFIYHVFGANDYYIDKITRCNSEGSNFEFPFLTNEEWFRFLHFED
jgi:hypothetical protein